MNIEPLVYEAIREVFDDDTLTVSRQTAPADIAQWDSLAQLNLMLVLEDKFGVHFSPDELTMPKNVGDLIESISRRANHRGSNGEGRS
jgi:acyl carrier protein